MQNDFADTFCGLVATLVLLLCDIVCVASLALIRFHQPNLLLHELILHCFLLHNDQTSLQIKTLANMVTYN